MNMKQRRFILVALALLSVSCINVYVTNAPVESRSVALTAKAEAIAVSDGIDVVVDPTLDRNEAVVTTHSDVIDYVKVYVEDSTLNIKLDAPLVITGSYTLDLNGFTLSYESDIMGEAMITNKGELTINDASK